MTDDEGWRGGRQGHGGLLEVDKYICTDWTDGNHTLSLLWSLDIGEYQGNGRVGMGYGVLGFDHLGQGSEWNMESDHTHYRLLGRI
jgi:hypothetical protein